MEIVGNHSRSRYNSVANWDKKFQSLYHSQSQFQYTEEEEESVMGETGYDEVVSAVKRGNSVVLSNNSSSHVCRHCGKVFGSGRALGGHVRVHGSGNGSTNGSRNMSRADHIGDYSSTDIWVKKPNTPTNRSNENSKWVAAKEREHDRTMRNMDMEEELGNQKMVSLYTLRRNPKRSKRITDEEFSLDLNEKNISSSRTCGECGKEFPSSKALFGHMRCHPQRNCRGIQPPYDDDNDDDDYDYDVNHNKTSDVGAFVVAPSSELSPVCWQSSQGSEDPEEKGKETAAAVSDNESDGESMKTGKTDNQQQKNLPTWSVTAKRGSRRSIRFIQSQPHPQLEEDVHRAKAENSEQLEDDRDTAHFLVMLASTASNTNTNNKENKVDRLLERQMTEESVYPAKTVKLESQGSGRDLEAEEEDQGFQEKMNKKRKTDRTARDGSFSKELGGAGKYKCSTCKKLFNSHQALGGHRASHRKVKGCFAMTNVHDGVTEEEEITEEDSSLLRIEYHLSVVEDDMMHSSLPKGDIKEHVHLSDLSSQQQQRRPQCATPIKKKKKAKGHECCVCNKVFPSGQALGGHKRCHWSGDRVSDTANSVISTEKQPKLLLGQGSKRKDPPLFDLNEPAPVDEEDLEAAYGMMDAIPACAKNVNQRVKNLEAVTNVEFTYVQCNICGCLCTSMEALRTHQIVHALMPAS